MKTQTKKLSRLKSALIGAAALVSSFLPLPALAAEPAQTQTLPAVNVSVPAKDYYIGRVRTENNYYDSETGKDRNLFKSTAEVVKSGVFHNAPFEDGVYPDGGTPLFRAYNYTGKDAGKAVDYTSLGFNIPFDIGNTRHIINPFGMIGDGDVSGRKGIGIQTKHVIPTDIGEFALTLNLEQEQFKQGKDSTRAGFGLDYAPDSNWVFGGRVDRLETAKGTTNQYFVHGLYSDKSIQGGLAYALQDTEGEKLNRFGGVFIKQGPSLGGRARFLLESGKKYGVEINGGTFEVIVAENTTFSAMGHWIVSGNKGDAFDLGIVEDAPEVREAVNLGKRVNPKKGGLVSAVSGSFYNRDGVDTNWIRGDVGYSFPIGEWSVTPLVGYRVDNNESWKKVGKSKVLATDKFGSVSGGLLIQRPCPLIKGGSWIVEISGSNPLGGADRGNPSWYGSINYQVRW